MTCVPKLMQRWLTGQGDAEIKVYHPKVQGFFNFLENFQVKEGDPIHSSAHITLQFTVKPDFERNILGWKGTKQIVLYLTLTASTWSYKDDEDVFVMQMTRGPVPQNQVTDQSFSRISNF